MIQGKPISDLKLSKILDLLQTSDLSMRDIADRVALAPASVYRVNLEYRIREYHGNRNNWTVNGVKVSSS